MKSPTVTLFLSISILGATAWSQTPVPEGEQFQINTYTTNRQLNPSAAVDPGGRFIVVWESRGSSGTDTDLQSVQGQRYDAAGMPAGGEIQVNSFTTNGQTNPAVAVAPDGDFVVVWESEGSAGPDIDGFSVLGQRFDAAGTKVGGEFEIHTYTTDNQFSPFPAVGADGDFVVVWSSQGSSGSDIDDYSIQGQRFNAAGTKVGGQFQVNTYTTDRQTIPTAAVAPDGDFVVVWTSKGSSGTDSVDYSVQGQRFNSIGMRVGGEFQINTYTPDDQLFPSVAAEADGDFVVVWHSGGSNDTDTIGYSIQGQRFDAAGMPVGGEFQVNTYTTNHQFFSTVAVEASGDFVVVWDSDGSSGTDVTGFSIQGQRFDAAGMPVGGEFQVNSYTTNTQASSSVAVGGQLVVVWESAGSSGTDTSDYSVQGQRLASPFFSDGFESGDTSAWSGTQ